MSNSLYPDQARHIVGPGLGPNCLQRSSADNICRQRVKTSLSICEASPEPSCIHKIWKTIDEGFDQN